MEAFYMGACAAFLTRQMVIKHLKWPYTSKPLRIVPEMILGGLFFSGVDILRRMSLQNILYKQQMQQIRSTLRSNQQNYDI